MSAEHPAGPSAGGVDSGFNLSSWTLRHQALVVFVLVLVTLLGIRSYSRLAQSEDPPFTF
jgi:multidrug efflux pump